MKCDYCHKEINGKYYIDQWGHNVCASHVDKKEVVMCASCGAFTSEKTLPDGRCLCKSCMDSVVKTKDEITECLKYVYALLKGVGFDFGSCNVLSVSVEIVSAAKIAQIRHAVISTNNKGVTNTQTLMRGTSQSDMKVVGHKHEIFMLSDLTKLEFQGTLAHELLHVWQNEHDIKLQPFKCEGLCNMGSYLVYSNAKSKLADFYLKNLKENPDPIYGDGFRYVLGEYEKNGWNKLISRVNIVYI